MRAGKAALWASLLIWLVGLAALSAGCHEGGGSSPTSVQEGSGVSTGVWGGTGIAVTTSPGGATFEFDCAHGLINQPILLDSSGRFSQPGTYVQEHGGPIRPGPQDAHPATFAGSIRGGNLSLTITLTDTGAAVGPFTAVLGNPPRVVKCL